MFIQNTSQASNTNKLQLHFESGAKDSIRSEIINIVSFLKKRFFFPEKCNVYFINKEYFVDPKDGHKFYCVFYDNEERNVLPQLYVAAKESKANWRREIIYYLFYGLSMYFQWISKETTSQKMLDEKADEEALSLLEEYEMHLLAQHYKHYKLNDVKQSLLKGQGRALAIIKSNPKKYSKLVVYACTHDVAWDKYNGTHADYIYEALSAYEDKEPFLDKIIKTISISNKSFLFAHLSWLLYCFSVDGYKKAQDKLESLYSEMYNLISTNPKVVDNFVSVCFTLTNSFEDYERISKDILSLFNGKKIDVQTFAWYIDTYYEDYKKEVVSNKNQSSYKLNFLLKKSEKDDVKSKKRTKSEPPDVLALLGELDKASPKRKANILQLLSRIRSEDIREHVLAHLTNDNYLELLPLLMDNSKEEDLPLITKYVLKTKISFNTRKWHNIISSIMLMNKPSKELLMFVYENSYCSFCRSSAFEELKEFNYPLDVITITEAHYDCEEEIRSQSLRMRH